MAEIKQTGRDASRSDIHAGSSHKEQILIAGRVFHNFSKLEGESPLYLTRQAKKKHITKFLKSLFSLPPFSFLSGVTRFCLKQLYLLEEKQRQEGNASSW